MAGPVQSIQPGGSSSTYLSSNNLHAGPRPGTVVTGSGTTVADVLRFLASGGSSAGLKKLRDMNPVLASYPPSKALPVGMVINLPDASNLPGKPTDTSDAFQDPPRSPPVALNDTRASAGSGDPLGDHMAFWVGTYDDEGDLTGFKRVGGITAASIAAAGGGSSSSASDSSSSSTIPSWSSASNRTYKTVNESNRGNPASYFLQQNNSQQAGKADALNSGQLFSASNSNCGPTSLAMVALALGKAPAGTSASRPETLIETCREIMTRDHSDDIYAATSADDMLRGAHALGLKATFTSNDDGGLNAMDQALLNGQMCAVDGNPAAYGQPDGWHWIVVGGVTKDSAGNITGYIVNDPNYTGRAGVVVFRPQMEQFLKGNGLEKDPQTGQQKRPGVCGGAVVFS